jgi:hypothetical protein
MLSGPVKISKRVSVKNSDMKIKFRDIHLSKANLDRLDEINAIIGDYQAQGYRLTLRQLYYQLVSADIIANKLAEYAKLSNLLKEGRMAGIVDWDAIEDRLRKPDKPASWDSSLDILNACIKQFRCDRMEGQSNYIEVWVEKDALSGVLKRVTEKYGIPIIVNRGYSSASAMFDAHERFVQARGADQDVIVIYIGDFDPSGQDMIRDITDRIEEFNTSEYHRIDRYDFEIIPIALLWSQIEIFNPPPNPAKIKDPRAKAYIAKHGPTSWEVDALRPEVLNGILTTEIEKNINPSAYRRMLAQEEKYKEELIDLKNYLPPNE